MIDPALSLLTTADLERLVPAQALAAGLDYLLDERVEQAFAWRDGLFARVRGFTGEYRVSIRARGGEGRAADGVATTCECELRQSVCRHGAAVLQAWVRRRDLFVDLDGFLASGAERSPEWWVEVVGRLCTAEQAPLDVLRAALWGDDPKTRPQPGEPPEATVRRAVELVGAGCAQDAVALLAAAFRRSPARMPPTAVDAVHGAVIAGFGPSLRAPRSAGERRIVDEAVGLWLAGLEADEPDTASRAAERLSEWAEGDGAGGTGASGDRAADWRESLLARAHLRAWELELAGEGPGARLRQGRIVAWLADAYERIGRTEMALAVLRQHRLAWGAAERLLRRLTDLGRLDEAIAEAAAWIDATAGYAQARPRRSLGELLLRRGERAAAGDQFAAAMHARPDLETYRLLRDARAGDAGWPAERARVLRAWRAFPQAGAELAAALFDEGDLDGVADLLRGGGWAAADRMPWIARLAGLRPRLAEALYREVLEEPLRPGDPLQRRAVATAMTALARWLRADARDAERDELLRGLRRRFEPDPVLRRRAARLLSRDA